MAESFTFDGQGVRRIVASVRDYEANRRIRPLHGGNKNTVLAPISFIARLTAVTGSSTKRYDFRQQRRNSANTGWEDMDGGLTSEDIDGMVQTDVKATPEDESESFRVGVTSGDIVLIKPTIDASGVMQFIIVITSGSSFFPCKITSHTQIANGSTTVGGGSSVSVDYKWKYAWTEMERTGDTVQVKSGGRSGTTTTDYAINEAEINHTVVFSWGQTINVAPYPVGFRPKAVGGANATSSQTVHSYDVIVEMQQIIEVGSGLTKYRFNKEWDHSGSCT